MILEIWVILTLCALDRHGTEFEDDGLTVLLKVESSLTSYLVPKSTITIKDGTYYNNAFGSHAKNLKHIYFEAGSNLVKVGSYSFYLSSIQGIDFSNCTKLKTIGNNAFDNAKQIKSIKFSDSITTFGSSSFANTQFTNVTLPKSLTSLPNLCFGNSKLQECNVSENCSLEKILSDAFRFTPMTFFRIPKTVTMLNNAWSDGNLQRIEVDPANTVMYSTGLAVYKTDNSSLLLCCVNMGDFVLNPQTTVIDVSCMRGSRFNSITFNQKINTIHSFSMVSTVIETIQLPDTITFLGENVFTYSTVKNITLSAGLKLISKDAFRDCKNLTVLEIPNGVTEIGESAFSGCSGLTFISFPSTITTLGNGAFKGVSADCEIKFEPGSSIIMIGRCVYTSDKNQLISYVDDSEVLKIEDGVKVLGKQSLWKHTFSRLELPSSLETLEEGCMYGVNVNSEINLPNVVTIGRGAFELSNISKISFGNKLTKISESAFSECYFLGRIELNEGFQSIGKLAFYKCTALESISLKSCVSIGETGFARCGLKQISFPPNTKSIGINAFIGVPITSVTFATNSEMTELGNFSFNDCPNLTYFNFPEKLQTIGESAFESCVALEEIRIPDSLVSIQRGAFRGCVNLKSVSMTDFSSLKTIEELAFESCLALKKVTIGANHRHFEAERGVLYTIGRNSIVLYLHASTDPNFTIPATVEKIDPFAFAMAPYLKGVSVGASVSIIGFKAFFGCSSLEWIYLPRSLQDIHGSAFAETPKLLCGGIEFEVGFNEKLLDNVGLRPEARKRCPTRAFTVTGNSLPKIDFAALVCLNDSD